MANVELRSLRVAPELDASKYTAGAQQKVAADKAMAASSQAAGSAVQQTDAKLSQSGDVLARLSRQYVEGYANAQRMQSAVNSLSRGIDTGKITMAQAQPILDGIFRKYGQIGDGAQFAAKGQHEFAAAITNTTARLSAQVVAANAAAAATSRIGVAANQNAAAANQNRDQTGLRPGNFNTANVAAQFQDIAVTSAMGMSPLQIALQQGTQLSAVLGPMGAAGAAKALGSALLSIVNPTSLVVLGLVGATAAAIQYFGRSRDDAKTLDDMLKTHADTISRIEEVWGKAAFAADSYGKRSSSAVGFGLSTDIAAMEKRLRDMIKPGMFGGSEIGNVITTATSDWLDDIGGTKFRDTELFKMLSSDIDAMVKSAREGTPDIIGFVRRLEELGAASDNAGIRGLASEISTALRDVEAFARALAEANRRKIELFNNVGPNGMLLSQGTTNREDMGNLALFQSQERIAAARRAEAVNAQLQGLTARSPEERAAAARASAAAQYSDSESAAARADRIETAGKIALAQATHSLSQAQEQRARSLDQILATQQLDIDLIGSTAGEQARLRMEFEQTSQLREEAARNGVAVDEKELASIKAKAEAYGQFADQIARANLNRDLSFERDQMLRSPADQAIASRQQGAGLPVDLNSAEAQQMREIARIADAKGLAVGFLTDFKSELLRNGGHVGEALGTAILNALTASMDKQLANIFDRLATAFASMLTGQQPGASAIGAASFGTAGGFASMLGIGANDNYAPGAVTRSPLAAVGSSMAAYRAAIKSIESEGSGGYSALGPWTKGDRAYGAYQVMGNNIPSWTKEAFGKSMTPGQFLGNPSAQDAVFDQQFGKSLAKYGNPQDAASVWFTGRPLAAGAGASDVLGTTGSAYVNKFNAALAKASDGLGGFDNTVTSAVKAITSSIGGTGSPFGSAGMWSALASPGFNPAPGGFAEMLGLGGAPTASSGGGGGFLSMLFGFLPKLFGFANGTENAPAGWAWVGERGPELRKLRGGDVIRNNATSMQMAANANRSQPAKIELHTHVYGGSGDDHIRMLSRQGAQEAIGEYHQGQERGGFGELQRRYASQKG
ncbi:phage tail length tape measure family protein [Mesorhizobium sp.]|uniref:phage tail length tape measure family protein n=1 Tax=Mesorhizobium sp. TaxID=1871066 RepID=UPI00257C139C|nr:phage tail length tape measure family protein [Mesorhizobium sp.]